MGQLCPGSKTFRQFPGELIGIDIEHLEVGQTAKFRRNRSSQPIVAEFQVSQVRQMAQFRRDLSSQLIGPEMQADEVRQTAKFRRNVPSQLISPEVQADEVRQTTQFRRDWAGQFVLGRFSSVTRPSSPVVTPYHSFNGSSVSQ